MKTVTTITLRLLALLLAVAAMGGCTQNDGDISPLFGTWSLDEVTRDGEVMADKPSMTWSFQSSVICFQTLLDHHDRQENWASWRRTSTVLTIDFDNHDNQTAAGEWPYNPPAGIGFEHGMKQVQLDIAKLTGKKIELVWDSPDCTYRYRLTKLY